MATTTTSTSSSSAAAEAARLERMRRIAEIARQRAEEARRAAAAAAAEKAQVQAQKQAEKAKESARAKPTEKTAAPKKVSNSDFEVTSSRAKRMGASKATRAAEKDSLSTEEVAAYSVAVKSLRQVRGMSEADAHRAVSEDPKVAGWIADAAVQMAEEGEFIEDLGAAFKKQLKANPALGLPPDMINPETGKPLTEADGAGRAGKADGSSKVGNVDVKDMSEAQRFDYYAEVIQKAGGKLRMGPSDRNILSFRNENSTNVNGGMGTYNDVTVMMWKDASGKKHVREYWSNTEPTAYYRGRMGQDANGDGKLDQGRIPTGYYEYRKSYSSRLGNVLRPTTDFRVERDINWDGSFDKGDRGATSGGGGSMLFHAGGSSATYSAGCQTMPPEVYQRFWNDLGSNPGTVGYTLVDGKPGQSPLVSATNATKEAEFSKTGLSLSQLKQIMPNLPAEKAESYLPFLNKAMKEANIDTPKRAAAFLAQLAHESAELKYFEEIASGAAYEGRRDLGNTQPGDGVRFKGRGPIQLTGRANYAAASKALGIDLVANPERAADPDVGFRVAAWYWTTRGLNAYADKGDFREITRRINGGYNGLESREAYYRRALNVLGGGLGGGPVATGDTPTPSTSSSYYGPSGYSSPGGRSPSSGYSGGSGGGGGGSSGGVGGSDGPSRPSYDRPELEGPESVQDDPFSGSPELESVVRPWAKSFGLDQQFAMFLFELLMGLIDQKELEKDPEFQDFVRKQPGMKNWKPGQPVPPKVIAKFLAAKMEKAMKGKKGDVNAAQDAAGALVQKYGKKEKVADLEPGQTVPATNEVKDPTAAPSATDAVTTTPPLTTAAPATSTQSPG